MNGGEGVRRRVGDGWRTSGVSEAADGNEPGASRYVGLVACSSRWKCSCRGLACESEVGVNELDSV